MRLRRSHLTGLFGLALLTGLAALLAGGLQRAAQASAPRLESAEAEEPPEVIIGERLFEETRFAQFYFAASGGDANAEPLANGGDPVVAFLSTPNGPIPSPTAGKSMSCRQCHFDIGAADVPGGGVRTYADFAARSPLPLRDDGLTVTARNSPTLVGLELNETAPAEIYHFDGEFPSFERLSASTFTGRNFGWLPVERQTAVRHIAQIIRNDNGEGDLALEGGGAYALVFAGKSPDPRFVLPPEFRIDVRTASDQQILGAVSKLVAAYVESLFLKSDENGQFDGSPYDLFLKKNGLPRKPDSGESDVAYSRRLRELVNGLNNPVYVSPADGQFVQSDQPFVFGAQELQGLKVFLAELKAQKPSTQQELAKGGVGNCMACHAAPAFTDFSFHNTGVSQQEYDGSTARGLSANC